MINPRFFCLLAMYDLDNYQADLLEAYAEKQYFYYLRRAGQVTEEQLRFVRFYKFYFRTELPRIHYLVVNSWGPLNSEDRRLWSEKYPAEFNRLQMVLTNFNNNSLNYAMHFNDSNDYPSLVNLSQQVIDSFNNL